MVSLLLILLTIAVFTDLRWHKIFNKLTYSGILVALLLNILASWCVTSETIRSDTAVRWGLIGWEASVTGFLLCGFLVVVSYVFFHVGGGDVKLVAMIGAFMGPDAGIQVLLWTFVFGACAGLTTLMWHANARRVAGAVWNGLRTIAYQGRLPLWTPVSRAQLQGPLHLAPSAMVAAIVVHFSLLERTGQLVGL